MRRHELCSAPRSIALVTLIAVALAPSAPAVAREVDAVVDLRTAPSWLVTGGSDIGPVGDVNGDGTDDMAVADCFAGEEAGAVRVVWGPFDTDRVAFDDPGAGFTILGAEHMDYACKLSRRAVGDVNGDGLADVLVAADRYVSGPATVYVVFGKSDSETVNLRDFDQGLQGDQGYVVHWNSGSQVGVEGVGDMDGDGLADFVVGGGSGRETYVVFGQSLPTPVETRTLDAGAGRGFMIRHNCRECVFGFAGDVDGDGVPDVGVGGVGRKRYEAPGSAYVVFGKSDSLPVDTTDGLTPQFFKIKGDWPGGLWDGAVSAAGDMNGDGLGDVILGMPASYGFHPAKTAVVFGKTDTETVRLAELGHAGFQIYPSQGNDSFGGSAVGVGDVNGDGLDDIAIGAYYHGRRGRGVTGAVFVIYGSKSPKDLQAGRLGDAGYVIAGRRDGDLTGHTVGAPGDMNGDGVPDLTISAPVGKKAYLLWM